MSLLWRSYLAAALGGALGAMLRYSLELGDMLQIWDPYPTTLILINAAGSLVLGFVAGMTVSRPKSSPQWRIFWMTGVCGGFTTLSGYSYKVLLLLQIGMISQALLFAAGSLLLAMAGVVAGYRLAVAIFKHRQASDPSNQPTQ
ncbi:MAG: CrcB family protein [Thermaerobacterales bacterium]